MDFARRPKRLGLFTDLDWVDHFGSSMASGGEREDKEITLDLNHLWVPRGGPTQAGEGSKSWRVLLVVEKKFRWCERGAHRNGRLPTQAPVLKGKVAASRGARRHGRFPPQAER